MLLANLFLLMLYVFFVVAICYMFLLIAFAMPLSDVRLIVDVLRCGFCFVLFDCSCLLFCVLCFCNVCCLLCAVCFCLLRLLLPLPLPLC